MTREIRCTKGESAFVQNTVTIWLKEFCSSCKNIDDQVRSSRLKAIDFIDADLMHKTRRVSGEIGISRFNMIHHLQEFSKSIRNRWIMPYVIKIFQTLGIISDYHIGNIRNYELKRLKEKVSIRFLFVKVMWLNRIISVLVSLIPIQLGANVTNLIRS